MVTGTNTKGKYVGLTTNTFKQRYGGHKQDFGNSETIIKSTPAGHIWNLKDKNEEP